MAKKPEAPRYTWNGKPVPSVTQILGMLNKPLLLPWATKEMEAYIIEAFGLNDSDISDELVVTKEKLLEVLKKGKSAYRQKSKEAMDIGTQVHHAIETWIHSNGQMTPDELRDERVRNGLKGFLQWGDEHEIEILAYEQEIMVWEQGPIPVEGKQPLYAGRFDLLAKVDGRITLIDFKTSKGAVIYDEYWHQLRAYSDGIYVDDKRVIPDRLAVLAIDKETGAINYEYKDTFDVDIMYFWHLAQAYNKRKGE